MYTDFELFEFPDKYDKLAHSNVSFKCKICKEKLQSRIRKCAN